MSRSACLRTMLRASDHGELAIAEGMFDVARPHQDVVTKDPCTDGFCSSFDCVCDWLELPRVAVVDLGHLDPCNLPRMPERLDALLLDNAVDGAHAAYWRTNFEALWKVPVLGWLDRAESLRSLCRSLPAGRDPSPALCAALGHRLLAHLDLERLLHLADRASFPPLPADDLHFELHGGPLRIAVAYDEDYCGYFPDTLDLLEDAGAELSDFSPLRSGSIPSGTDIVYLGCGHPERQPEVLAGNHCLRQSLRSFAAAGGRIYAEGSGLAYLCREIELEDGRRVPMSGLLPAIARREMPGALPTPAEICFRTGCWMVEGGTVVRGYRHPAWRIEPCGELVPYAQNAGQGLDVIGRGNVIGSRIMVNLAANEHLLQRFIQPRVSVAAGSRRQR
ncbi:MAG: hypothetical protein WD872_21065 [Pirellulaceae bacterium]